MFVYLEDQYYSLKIQFFFRVLLGLIFYCEMRFWKGYVFRDRYFFFGFIVGFKVLVQCESGVIVLARLYLDSELWWQGCFNLEQSLVGTGCGFVGGYCLLGQDFLFFCLDYEVNVFFDRGVYSCVVGVFVIIILVLFLGY